jgi:hypothetical protein
LAIDGTERRRQRPKAIQIQQDHYSGKKKTHTDKHSVVVNETTHKGVYLSPTVAGKTHDKTAADAVNLAYPANAICDKDTGVQGYQPDGVQTRQPKKSRKASN